MDLYNTVALEFDKKFGANNRDILREKEVLRFMEKYFTDKSVG